MCAAQQFTHTLEFKYITPGGQVLQQVSYTEGQEANLSEDVADGETDLQLNWACDVSAIQLIEILSDQDLTLETNDGTTPDDTITLEAGKPLVWYKDDPVHSNPFSADVTALFATNGSGASAALEIRCLVDPTP